MRHVTKEQIEDLYVVKKFSIPATAMSLKISREKLKKLMIEYGIKTRSAGENYRHWKI